MMISGQTLPPALNNAGDLDADLWDLNHHHQLPAAAETAPSESVTVNSQMTIVHFDGPQSVAILDKSSPEDQHVASLAEGGEQAQAILTATPTSPGSTRNDCQLVTPLLELPLAETASGTSNHLSVKAQPRRAVIEMTIAEAEAIAGTLSKVTKLPGRSYDLDTDYCRVGSELRKVPGSECAICYATRGHYNWPNVTKAMERRRQGLTHPLWVDAMVTLIKHFLESASAEQRYFRWHASGDLQSLDHLKKIVKVAELVPEMNFWLQTKERSDVGQFLKEGGQFPANLVTRLSSTMIGVQRDGLSLPISVITQTEGTPPEGAHACPATAPDSEGKCGDCRACWNPNVPIVSFWEHGRHVKQPAHKAPKPTIDLPVPQPRTEKEQEDADQPSFLKTETRVPGTIGSRKLSREEAVALDDRISEAFREDKQDHTTRMLSIAPDVARITRDKSFTLLGFKSKEAYFQSRHESKPYMRALEIIGNSDVEAIRDLAAEHHLSWKVLQIFSKVESDPAQLVTFIEKYVAAVGRIAVRKLEGYLKALKNPNQAQAQGQQSKAKEQPENKIAPEDQVSTTTYHTQEQDAVSTWESVATDFERGLDAIVGSAQADEFTLAKLTNLKLRINAAIERSMARLERWQGLSVRKVLAT